MFLASTLESNTISFTAGWDNNEDPDLVLRETKELYSANNSSTEIIAGSITPLKML